MENTLPNFNAHPLIPGGHLQTLVPALMFRFKKFAHDKLHQVVLDDGDKIAVLANFANSLEHYRGADVLLVHGLGSSAHEINIVRHTQKLLALGFNVYRMNHRGIGEGSQLSRNIYHADRAEDISQVVSYLASLNRSRKLIVVGYSLSANMVLKLMGKGELESWSSLTAIDKALCICPAIDMKAASHAVSRSIFGLYNSKFVDNVTRYLQRRNQYFPDTPKLDQKSVKTLMDVDQYYVCREAGYDSAEEYYEQSSPAKWLDNIRRQTVVLCSSDDPISVASERYLRSLANIDFHLTRSGGHLGFLARKKRSLKVHAWLDDFVIAKIAGT